MASEALLAGLRWLFWQSSWGDRLKQSGAWWYQGDPLFGDIVGGFIREYYHLPPVGQLPQDKEQLYQELLAYMRRVQSEHGVATKRRFGILPPARRRIEQKVREQEGPPRSVSDEDLADHVEYWRGRFWFSDPRWQDIWDIARAALTRHKENFPDGFDERLVRVVKILRKRATKKGGETRKRNIRRKLLAAEAARQTRLFERDGT